MIKKNTKPSEKNAEQQQPVVAFLLELEYMLFPGRQLAFEAYRNVLKKHSIALDEMSYARYCLKRNIAMNLKGLFTAQGKKCPDEKGVEETALEIAGRFSESLADSAAQPANSLYEFLHKADEQNIKIGLLSFLAEEEAGKLMSRLQFKNAPALLVMKKKADDLPTPDAWLSLLKMMAIDPRSSFAFINSATAHRSALAVGMRCAVIPDNFTSWQDFSGADLVLENTADLKISDLLAILSPAHYRK